MWLSECSEEMLDTLTRTQRDAILYGYPADDGTSAEVALLLGGNERNCTLRAAAAAELYHAGRVPYIMPSGGVEREIGGRVITEALFMKELLMQSGVPESAILVENEARTTVENLIYGTLQIYRILKTAHVDHVIIVTSDAHMQRSLAMAHQYMPRKFRITGYPAKDTGDFLPRK